MSHNNFAPKTYEILLIESGKHIDSNNRYISKLYGEIKMIAYKIEKSASSN